MLQRMLLVILADVVIVASVFMPQVSAQSEILGDWEAKLEDSARINLNLRTGSWGRSSNWGHTMPLADLRGFDAAAAQGTDSRVRFELARDAGTAVFEGQFTAGKGSGAFRFTPNPEYLVGMSALGYSGLSTDKVFSLFGCDVTSTYVRELNDAGYSNLKLDQVIAMRIHGVTPEMVKGMRELRVEDLTADSLIAMRIHGVSTDYVRELISLGYNRLDADQLVAMRIHGVTAGYVRELSGLGYKQVDTEKLVAMRIHGVSPDFIREVHNQGYKDASVDDLLSMRIHGRRGRSRPTV